MQEAFELSPTLLGAEILARVGRERATGLLCVAGTSGGVRLLFLGGRPEAYLDRQGQPQRNRQQLIARVRALANATAGQGRLEPSDASAFPASLGVDPLGEALVGLLSSLRGSDVDTILEARGKQVVEPTAAFDRLAQAVAQVAGQTLERPEGPSLLGGVVIGEPTARRRAWIALLALGGLRVLGPKTEATSTVSSKSGSQAASVPQAREHRAPPKDPKAIVLIKEIETTRARLEGKDHYQVLGVSKGTNEQDIRKAYFELAKRWHTDHFASLGLGDEATANVNHIFRLIGEAYSVLSDAEQRQAYGVMLEREAQGLPTDPQALLEAEGLFRKAQGLVRRGQAPAAEPLLQKVVAINKAEADFRAYLGFAIFAAHGKNRLADAMDHVNAALKINDRCDAAYEFLGRIQRVEGKTQEAIKNLRKAIELNPRNRDAELELRVLNRRQSKSVATKGPGALLSRLLKR